jgi:hypothetical protein
MERVSCSETSAASSNILTIPSVFYLLIAMNAAGTACWFFFYHPPNFEMKHGRGKKMQFIKDFDYIGMGLVTLGLLLFLMGLSWGGALHPWKSAHVISTLVVGALLLIAFGLYETFMKLKEPLLPVHLLGNRGLMLSILLWSIGASVYYAFAIVWPSMLATLYADKHTDPMWVGYAALAVPGGISIGEILGSLYPKKVRRQIQVVFFLGSILLAGKSQLCSLIQA